MRYYEFFNLLSVRAYRINRNISQKRHNLKTLRLLQFRLKAMDTMAQNCWPRLLGSAVIQLYAGECTPNEYRALI